jgi:DNA repair protein RecN (Recombination protein N)
MLQELRIQNFAIIDELTVPFAPGLVVLTGETGAGKSIIIDAIELLLGGRGDATFLRAGADAASVEGEFALSPESWDGVRETLDREGLIEEPGHLVLAREIRREGRNIARVNGRTVSLSILREVGENLVDVHGQSEHLSLLRVREHVRLLDRFAGLESARGEFASCAEAARRIKAELESLRTGERDAARRADMLRFQIGEIESARLKPGEEAGLLEERTRLANAEQLAALVEQAVTALDEGGDDRSPASDLLGNAAHALTSLARIDPQMTSIRDMAQGLLDQASELARDLRTYRESVEFNPKRLEQVEERIELVHSLRRKYGESIEAVLAFAECAQQELDGITHADERMTELLAAEQSGMCELGRLGAILSQQRRQAAETMSHGIESELGDLHMAGAQFSVDVHWEEDPQGAEVGEHRVAFDATGLDRVEFLVAPNPGEGLKPLAKVASGGETSRLMLALKSVLARADQTPTLIFDEIDQGIGGRVGLTVGRKLWKLTPQHQVLCVTHLPQLAAYGDQHLHVEKAVLGERTTTRVRDLAGSDRVNELAAMLGAASETTRESANEILRMVDSEKQSGAENSRSVD